MTVRRVFVEGQPVEITRGKDKGIVGTVRYVHVSGRCVTVGIPSGKFEDLIPYSTRSVRPLVVLTQPQHDALNLLAFNGGEMSRGDLRSNGFNIGVIHRLCRIKLAYCAVEYSNPDAAVFRINHAGREALR